MTISCKIMHLQVKLVKIFDIQLCLILPISQPNIKTQASQTLKKAVTTIAQMIEAFDWS